MTPEQAAARKAAAYLFLSPFDKRQVQRLVLTDDSPPRTHGGWIESAVAYHLEPIIREAIDAATALVHQRLDEMGIAPHADRTGEDRLGVRLMLVERAMDGLRAEVERLRGERT